MCQGLRPKLSDVEKDLIPKELMSIYEDCILENPDDRPSFEEVATLLSLCSVESFSQNSKEGEQGDLVKNKNLADFGL